MADKPEVSEAEKKKIRVEAKRLATEQGLKWPELPQEKRKEFVIQARKQVRSAGDQGGSGAEPKK